MALNLYRLESSTADYGETATAIVWAHTPEDAQAILDEAFASEEKWELPGYVARSGAPYAVTEVPCVRGLVLAEGQDG